MRPAGDRLASSPTVHPRPPHSHPWDPRLTATRLARRLRPTFVARRSHRRRRYHALGRRHRCHTDNIRLRRRRGSGLRNSADRAVARLRTSTLLSAWPIACDVVSMVDGGSASTALAASAEHAHRISPLASPQSRSSMGRPCPHRRSESRNEIVIEDHVIDRMVRFCGLRDEGKIKGQIHVPRIWAISKRER